MALALWLKKSDRGSLIPLSFGFFIISITLIFISINGSTAYATKKQLTNIAEAAINKAAHTINLPAYYAQLNRFQSNKKVPIDCSTASQVFSKLINEHQLSGNKISITSIDCDLYSITAELSVLAKLPIQIPFFTIDNISTFNIRTQVGASSEYLAN
jgi:hypothetical protein